MTNQTIIPGDRYRVFNTVTRRHVESWGTITKAENAAQVLNDHEARHGRPAIYRVQTLPDNYEHHPRCICVLEPKGEAGLEGYSYGAGYRYERCAADKFGRPYYRVWPTDDSNYYETCSPVAFRKYFKA